MVTQALSVLIPIEYLADLKAQKQKYWNHKYIYYNIFIVAERLLQV
jgi:hypothetical protein